jgi:hypothetical protein
MEAVTKQHVATRVWSETPRLVKGLGTLLGTVGAFLTVLIQLGAFNGTAQPSAPASVRSLDRLLQTSADTRRELGPLIADVQAEPPRIAEAAARSRIDEIVAQRQSLRTSAAAVVLPDSFARAARLLDQSIVASLKDDRIIRDWIGARYVGDADTEERLWREQLAASNRATRLKNAFRAEYNKLRAELDLPAFHASY